MNTVRILFILLIFQTQNCYGQRDNSDSLINKFKANIEIQQKENSGIVGMDAETKESYYLAMGNCSIENLVKYTNDTNAFLRSYIFAGLLQRKVNKNVLLKILDIHKNDTTEFTSQSVDVVIKWKVNEFMKTLMILKSDGKLGHINYKKRIEELRNRTTNEPEILIDGIHHSLIEKDKLLKIDSLFLTVNKMKIVSFTLYITSLGGSQEFKSSTNALTNDMKNAIKKTESGGILVFDDIRVMGEDKRVRQLGLKYIKLK